MTVRHSRRAFMARAMALGAGAAGAALLGRRAPAEALLEYGGDCDMTWGRETRPYKGFASVSDTDGGQCTTHAALRFDGVAPRPGVNWLGNARHWYLNAAAAGWVVTDNLAAARRGMIAVWGDSRSYTSPAGNGHVAFVETVWPEGFTVSEMNWGFGCAGEVPGRARTSMWGIVSHTPLSWEAAQQRGRYRFAGFIVPERRHPSPSER